MSYSQKAVPGRQEFYAKLHKILSWRFFHVALDGPKTELIFRCIDSQMAAALGRQKFDAKLHNILWWQYWSWRVTADSPKNKGINGNRPLRDPPPGCPLGTFSCAHDWPIGQRLADLRRALLFKRTSPTGSVSRNECIHGFLLIDAPHRLENQSPVTCLHLHW